MNVIAPLPSRPSAAAAVVAVHCSASSPRQWDGYRALLDPAVSLLTPALPGYEDARPWPNGSPTTLDAEARPVLAAMASRREPVDLVGHSYGGAVALQAALLAPERVRSLTLYEPCLFAPLDLDGRSAGPAQEIGSLARRIALLSLSGNQIAAGALFVDYWSGRGAWASMAAPRQAAVARAMPKVRAEFGASFQARLRLDALARAGVPVRLLCGERSPAPVRRIVQLLARQLPHAELHRVAGATHMAPVAAKESLAALLFPHSLPRALRLAA